jgi:hypothetical protein
MRLETGPRGLLFDEYEEDIVKDKKVILKKEKNALSSTPSNSSSLHNKCLKYRRNSDVSGLI